MDSAEVLAESDFCPFAGLVYGDNIVSLQAHPEFSRNFEQQLIDIRTGEVIPPNVAAHGLTTLADEAAQPDSSLVARWFVRFLRGSARSSDSVKSEA